MGEQKELFDLNRLNDLNLIEVISRLGVRTWRAGVNHKMLCPWHPDHDPSLVLYNKPGDRHCHCYACNEHHSLIDLVMELEGWSLQEACSWLSKEFGVGTLPRNAYVPRPKRLPVKAEEPTDYTYIPMTLVDQMVSVENSLCRCLMHMAHSQHAPWTPQAVEWAVEEYRIGSYALSGDDDWTVFPLIDVQGRVCNVKIQHYDTDPLSQRFGHDNRNNDYMLGCMLIRQGELKPADGLKPEQVKFRSTCLFGEHLLLQYPNTTVALVESPKNALFGHLAFPEMLWIAVGNKHNLNRTALRPLQARDVMVFPDRDAIPMWTERLSALADLANFSVSDFCLRHAPADQPKFDIADFLQMEIMGK